ncbi:MAG TPA: AGE family epimerase/isomerase [Pirellulaceae bacterium]|nr:AGE family epimerase/isomerase [Pirellulaceae bacterium]
MNSPSSNAALVTTPQGRHALAEQYRETLLANVMPFWLRHGLDRQHGGYLTALDRDGTVVDTDKSIWFQGRGAWMFATLHNQVEAREEWLEASRSGIEFLRRHGRADNGKLYFTVTRDGRPLRMRRYVYSEAFAAIASATFARATGEAQAADEATDYFATYLRHSFQPGLMSAKTNTTTRPTIGIGPRMIAIVTAQQLREQLGDIEVGGQSCTQWIDQCIDEIERYFVKPDLQVVMETVGPQGELLDHFDGRQLNPGHALEAAWFILHEAKLRSDARLRQLGLTMLDWMWERGWDREHGGLFYFRDLRGLPVAEYWHDMKFWWPHCEAIIATLLAWTLTGDERYARWHQQVHDWSLTHFADREYGEWYGYLHRDGRLSVPLKGNLWKGPFHLPRMLLYCWQLLEASGAPAESTP